MYTTLSPRAREEGLPAVQALHKAIEGRVCESAVVSTAELVFSPELRAACESGICGNYGRTWTCPPAAGTVEELKARILAYKNALVFTTKHDLEDSFDVEGMQRGKELHNRLSMEVRERFGETNPVYGAGGCVNCVKCSYPGPCKSPEKQLASLEAAGINVSALSRSAEIRYNNGPNTVTYFSMVLF
jgi:predicted metal-binding protein